MRVEERDEQPYRGTSRSGPDATSDLTGRLSEIFEWLEIRGVEPAGTPFFRYHTLDDGRELEVEAGVPVPRGSAIPASDEDVTAGMLPAGRYAVTRLTGGSDELVRGTADLLAWAAERNLRLDRDGNTWISRLLSYPVDPDADEVDFELAIKLTD